VELDPRLLRVGIEINGVLKLYEGLQISASGSKFANANQNECEVKIDNLDKATRDFLLTETSPFNTNKRRKILTVEAGRVSSGYTLVFSRDITNALGGQPPDISITLKAATSDYSKGVIVANSQPGQAPLRNIAAKVAQDLSLSLQFEARARQISNYTFTGAAVKQVEQLGRMGNVNAYIDDRRLVIKDFGTPLQGQARVVDLSTGMIGIPEFSERGIKVTMLFDNQVALGGALDVRSQLNPAASGIYTIYKLDFQLANRDTPFYYTAEAQRIPGTF